MKPILFLFLVLFATASQANTYYVSATGNNSNDGLSAATAWQTIAKVNSFNFAANDNVLFNRGNTFYGGIIVNGSNINYGAYGSGAKPIITGLSTVSGWVSLGGNIWEAPVTNVKNGVNLVVRNGTIQQVGRYPNTDAANGGYLTYTAATNTSITGSAQSSTTNWAGAEVAIRASRWEILRKQVASHSGGVVSFATNPVIPRVNYGYFFQRDSRTLDLDGEWWHDAINNKLRMYFGNNSPASYNIQIATVDTLFRCQGLSYITISDISFNGSNKGAIMINGGVGITTKNCDVNNSGAQAITAMSAKDVTVDNCTAINNLGSGIRLYSTSAGPINLAVKNCTVTNTAYIAGMETSNEGNQGVGILCIGGDNIQVLNNSISNSGYNGIAWQGNNAYIKYNLVNGFNLVRDDGGGIYTWEGNGSILTVRTNRNLISNIVLNGIGNNQGTNDLKSTSTKGLYFDLGTANVIADSNTIAYVRGSAIHGNNNATITIRNNTFFGNGKSYSFQRFAGAPSIRGIILTKNIHYPYRFEYRNLGINSPSLTKEADILAMGILDSNYYSIKSGIDTSISTVITNTDGTNYQEKYDPSTYLTGTVGIEKHSINVVNTGTLEYNASNVAKVVPFSGLSKKDVYGNVYNNSVTIAAYSSKVLIPNGTATTSNKNPVANAGADKTITLPTNSVSLTGTGTDADGTIASFAWVKINGPVGDIIVSPGTASTAINNLLQGIYTYELTVKDNLGAIDKDTLQITVNSTTALPAPTLLPAVNPAYATNGLDYVYYEGNWNVLPSFSSLTPIKSGYGSNFILTPANRATQYGFSFNGYVNVPSDGTYTFYTSSDDGSALYIDNVLTVLNDSIHGTIEKSGVIGLKAGKHYIKGLFFQQAGGAVFTVSYAGNGIVKQAIPATALYRDNLLPSVNPANTVNGLDYKYYEGNWTVLPSFSSLTPIKSGYGANFTLTPANRTTQYGFNFTGYINVPADGIYTFYTSSDDGSSLYIDNVLTVLNDSIHGTIEKSGVIGLKAGKHYITGLFFQQAGGAVFTVSYASNGIVKQAIPASALYRTSTTTTVRSGDFNNGITQNTAVNNVNTTDANGVDTRNQNKAFNINTFPNPFTNEFTLKVEGGNSEKLEILVMDAAGRTVYQSIGTTDNKYKLGNNFVRGLYIIKVIQGNAVRTLKLIKI